MADNHQEIDKVTVVRPSWFPERLEWFPGEDTKKAKFKIREGNRLDVVQLSRFMKTNPNKLLCWVTQHGYSVWVISRNARNIIAAIAVRHGPEESTVLRFFRHPDLPLDSFLPHLLVLSMCEMPEYPLRWKVKLSDAPLTKFLRDSGWVVEETSDDSGYTELTAPAPLGS